MPESAFLFADVPLLFASGFKIKPTLPLPPSYITRPLSNQPT